MNHGGNAAGELIKVIIFKVLAITAIGNNNTELNKLTAEIWDVAKSLEFSLMRHETQEGGSDRFKTNFQVS